MLSMFKKWTPYTPGAVLITIDPVMWESNGYIYGLDKPGAKARKATLEEMSKSPEEPLGLPARAVIIKTD